MNHEQVQRILSSKRSIDAASQQAVDAHLATCVECQQFAAMVDELQNNDWNPYRKPLLSPEKKHDLLAALTPQVRRKPMFKKSPHTNWATALAAVAVIAVIGAYLFTLNRDLAEVRIIATDVAEQVTVDNPNILSTATVTPIPADLEETAEPTTTPRPGDPFPQPTETATPTATITREPDSIIVEVSTITPTPTLYGGGNELLTITPPTITPLPTPQKGDGIRRQEQLVGEQWVATLQDRIVNDGEYALHTVTLTELYGDREYVVYETRENVGLGGLWVELLDFSADNQHFYFTPGLAWHGCKLFGGGGEIIQVDLADGSTTNFENLTGFAHTFSNDARVAFVVERDVIVYDFATEEQRRFALPIEAENAEVGGLAWHSDKPNKLAVTVAVNPCGADETRGLFTLNVETGDVIELAGQTPALRNYRAADWQGSTLTLMNLDGELEARQLLRFESAELGISFHALSGGSHEQLRTEVDGETVYLMVGDDGRDAGQSVQVFEKSADEPFEDAVWRIAGENDGSCIMNVGISGDPLSQSRYPESFIVASLSRVGDAAFCSSPFSANGGIQYFVMDETYPNRLAFFRIGQYNIPAVATPWQATFRFNAQTSAPSQPDGSNVSPAISAIAYDGTIAFVQDRTLFIQSDGNLVPVDACSESETSSSCDFGHLKWSPDGETLLYTRGIQEGSLRLADKQGRSHLIADNLRNRMPGEWSPDGSQILFMRSTDELVGDADVIAPLFKQNLWTVALSADNTLTEPQLYGSLNLQRVGCGGGGRSFSANVYENEAGTAYGYKMSVLEWAEDGTLLVVENCSDRNLNRYNMNTRTQYTERFDEVAGVVASGTRWFGVQGRSQLVGGLVDSDTVSEITTTHPVDLVFIGRESGKLYYTTRHLLETHENIPNRFINFYDTQLWRMNLDGSEEELVWQGDDVYAIAQFQEISADEFIFVTVENDRELYQLLTDNPNATSAEQAAVYPQRQIVRLRDGNIELIAEDAGQPELP